MSGTSERELPAIVKAYRERYDEMAKPECTRELLDYTRDVLRDPIEGLDWRALLNWEHRHLKYTREELPKPRAEMPVDILKQARGRCGEFALLYNGLLLANGYNTRILIDCSALRDKSKTASGDHVWNEVFVDGGWTHVDPTERKVDNASMYAKEWNKDVNLIYAIARNQILESTETYTARS